MEQYPIPQFIEQEGKIAFFISFRQFFYIVGAGAICFILYFALRQITGNLDEDRIFSSFFKIAAAAIPMALAIQYLKYPLARIFNLDYFGGVLGQGILASLAGLAIYGLICYLLKVPELLQLKEALTRRWLQTKNLPTTESIINNE